jgi:hypothetical protein
VLFLCRWYGVTLKKAAQQVIDNRRTGLRLKGTSTSGLFCDVIVAAGGTNLMIQKYCSTI